MCGHIEKYGRDKGNKDRENFRTNRKSNRRMNFPHLD
jgi:hypothetical protein